MSQHGLRGGRKMVEKAEGLSIAQQENMHILSASEAEVFILLQKLWTEKLNAQIVLSVLISKHLESRSEELVESLEDKLTLCRQALEEVDFKLRREELTSARRESLEKEKNMLETKAEIYEKELKMLRHENRKTVALSAAIILLVFVIYTCWTM